MGLIEEIKQFRESQDDLEGFKWIEAVITELGFTLVNVKEGIERLIQKAA